jgi:hypothetical protein
MAPPDPRSASEGDEGDHRPGHEIWVWSWWGNAVFAVTAIPAVLGVGAFDEVSVGTALLLFVASLVVWGWAFAVAAVRSSHGDDIVVGSMFFTVGNAPRSVRRQLFGALAACLVVTFATAWAEPFGVLVPMLPLGLVGLWAARHGEFPLRHPT